MKITTKVYCVEKTANAHNSMLNLLGHCKGYTQHQVGGTK